MAEKYTREYEVYCPRTQKKAKHTVEYARATCTRVPDTMLHFHCGLEGSCKDCEKDYLDWGGNLS